MKKENEVNVKEFNWGYVSLPDIFRQVMAGNFRIRVATLDCIGFLMRLEDNDENVILEVFAQIRSERYKNIGAFIVSDQCRKMKMGILGDVVKSGFTSLIDSNCSIREIRELLKDRKLKGDDRDIVERVADDTQEYIKSWLGEQSKKQEGEDNESLASLSDKYHTPEKMAEYEKIADKLERMSRLMTDLEGGD